MKFELKPHKNGYLFKAIDEDEGVVCQESGFSDEHEAWKRFLCEILENYGPQSQGSRYAEKRIYVCIRPGDKFDGKPDYEAAECWKRCEFCKCKGCDL